MATFKGASHYADSHQFRSRIPQTQGSGKALVSFGGIDHSLGPKDTKASRIESAFAEGYYVHASRLHYIKHTIRTMAAARLICRLKR